MANKPANPSAKEALNQMKLEIANELGLPSSNKYGSNNSAYENGLLGGRVGGLMSRELVKMGEEELVRQYNNKNK